jgi:cell division protein FtsI/penicillin-binding protein 2
MVWKNVMNKFTWSLWKKRIEVDSLGKEQSVLAQEAPEAGSHLQMAIDSQIQISWKNNKSLFRN